MALYAMMERISPLDCPSRADGRTAGGPLWAVVCGLEQHSLNSPETSQLFRYNPFPYLPPELIVSILSHTPASCLPQLYSTDKFFRTHIDIYHHQLIHLRLSQYPSPLISAYSTIHTVDFSTLHLFPLSEQWSTLSKFEDIANVCLSVRGLLHHSFPVDRFYIAFLRQWQSRRTMFFTRSEWQEALLERFHIYGDCSRPEICDIVHLQMLYRNLLTVFPWGEVLSVKDVARQHWSLHSDLYRGIVDQIIACGVDFILHLLRLPTEQLTQTLRLLFQLWAAIPTCKRKFNCFDHVMAKLLTRFDGDNELAMGWQEEDRYFDVCASTRYFCEGDQRGLSFGE
jgi:hypothetical protein